MSTTTSTTTVTAEELAARLDEILDRVKHGGETFIVESDGMPMADITPRPMRSKLTLHEFLDRLLELGEPDPEFADDVRWARENQGYPRVVDWPD